MFPLIRTVFNGIRAPPILIPGGTSKGLGFRGLGLRGSELKTGFRVRVLGIRVSVLLPKHP